MELFNSFILFLKDANLPFEIRNTETIAFDYHNLHFLFRYNKEQDANYFQILLPRIQKSGVTTDWTGLANLNAQIKSVKSISIKNQEGGESYSVWLSCEQFIYSDLDVDHLFKRMIDALEAYLIMFRNQNK